MEFDQLLGRQTVTTLTEDIHGRDTTLTEVIKLESDVKDQLMIEEDAENAAI